MQSQIRYIPIFGSRVLVHRRKQQLERVKRVQEVAAFLLTSSFFIGWGAILLAGLLSRG